MICLQSCCHFTSFCCWQSCSAEAAGEEHTEESDLSDICDISDTLSDRFRKPAPFVVWKDSLKKNMSSDARDLEVAIIGGGITGLALALGLLQRDVKFTIYERARELREIGAGIGFTLNAERAMLALSPHIHQSFRKVAVQNNDDYFRYIDGSKDDYSDLKSWEENIWLKKYLGERGFEGCRRSDFIMELVKALPADSIKYQKNLSSVEDTEASKKITLTFSDGTTEKADIGTQK